MPGLQVTLLIYLKNDKFAHFNNDLKYLLCFLILYLSPEVQATLVVC